jgi:hypothetical protein
MEEEKDVTSTEEVDSSSTSEVDESSETSTGEGEQSAENADNRIPHTRVKEMTGKAYQKGLEDALRKLVDEHFSNAEKEPSNEDNLDEQAKALRTLEKTVEKVVRPYFIKQEVKEFLNRNEDAVKYIDSIKEFKKKNPSLDWEEAYKLSAFDDKMKEAETAGRTKRETVIENREKAKTERPVATRPAPNKPFNEAIKGQKSSDIETMIRERFFKRS